MEPGQVPGREKESKEPEMTQEPVSLAGDWFRP